jgi:PIN domain nuclease of toxin-antitoxin system
VLLLDTHAAAWLVTRPLRLSSAATGAIQKRGSREGLAVASVTLMELAQMLSDGVIQPRGTPVEWLRDFVFRTGVVVKELTVDIAAVAGHLPPTFPSDPFDRVIAATAIVERMPLVTSDGPIQRSRVVQTIW